LRFLRLAGAFFATCLLAFSQISPGLAPVTRLALLGGFGLSFGTSLGPLFAGLTHLLLLAVPGDRLRSLDLLSSAADL
jgi:hypothetical protein